VRNLAWWARRKGITVLGTGDFTHPAWAQELRETLEPAEPGLFRLRPDIDAEVLRKLPPTCHGEVRFMLEVEISTIYKRDDRTRKVHHLCYVPSFEAADAFTRSLAKIGNLGSDGRPILGLDSRDLLEITLESGEGSYLVPAHVWTPWFAVLGSKSGFDAVADCYADLAGEVFAVETGLSSDPSMNWRVSGLDSYTLVSNSDAHSPPILGRNATVFDTELSYFALRDALRDGPGYVGTVDMFPEEGKYFLDGHRKCDVRMEPAETKKHGAVCPECEKPLTVGVLHRIEELSDRETGARPANAGSAWSIVPLPEIMGEILKVGPKSKTVNNAVTELVASLGPELPMLLEIPLDDLKAARNPLVHQAISRLRAGQVRCDPGFDGEYGTISMFAPGEMDAPTEHSPVADRRRSRDGQDADADPPDRASGDRSRRQPGWLPRDHVHPACRRGDARTSGGVAARRARADRGHVPPVRAEDPARAARVAGPGSGFRRRRRDQPDRGAEGDPRRGLHRGAAGAERRLPREADAGRPARRVGRRRAADRRRDRR
jgi:DNA helicase-2/ATP-dependent DNA helicase PcrA